MYESQRLTLRTLESQAVPTNLRQIHRLLRRPAVRVPKYRIVSDLRLLMHQGLLSSKGDRWTIAVAQEARPSPFTASVMSALKLLTKSVIKRGKDSETLNGPSKGQSWARFRALLKCYTARVPADSRAEPQAYIDQDPKRIIHVRGIGRWYPQPGSGWQYSSPLALRLCHFAKKVAMGDSTQPIALGYPIRAVTWTWNDEPPTSSVHPVFHIPLSYKIGRGAMSFYAHEAWIGVNPRWLQNVFTSFQEQNVFLRFCRLFRPEKFDKDLSRIEFLPYSPTFLEPPSNLGSYLQENFVEHIAPDRVHSDPIRPGAPTGIYNGAIIMITGRKHYFDGLLKELPEIEKANDSSLNETAPK